MSKELQKQFDRAEKLGWLPFFVEAVSQKTEGYFDEADLMGIASRETNLDPKWLTKPGDGGNGFGLMQADRRSFPEFTKGDGWKDARTGILFGAQVLMHKLTDTKNCMGRSVSVKSSKGGTYHFVGKKLAGSELQRVVIAAYNAGRWGHYAASTGRDVDSYTTGKNYSRDVMKRAAFFRPLIKKWKAEQLPAAVSNPGPDAPAAAEPVTIAENPSSAEEPKQAPAASISLKDFSDKYLKHTRSDTFKNIVLVILGRIFAYISALWAFGLSGKIFLVVLGVLAAGSIIYALIFYRQRLWGWIKTILGSLSSSP